MLAEKKLSRESLQLERDTGFLDWYNSRRDRSVICLASQFDYVSHSPFVLRGIACVSA
jgi:hypothetical protein